MRSLSAIGLTAFGLRAFGLSALALDCVRANCVRANCVCPTSMLVAPSFVCFPAYFGRWLGSRRVLGRHDARAAHAISRRAPAAGALPDMIVDAVLAVAPWALDGGLRVPTARVIRFDLPLSRAWRR